ncbi:MAG: DNA methylase [Deltaproteobacteria bacterium]|nr:DNA methylase [Deltaproteobacteria bacterium]
MRHRFHSICPYFAMFPEQFVQKHLIWSKPGDVVLDPFVGRGTTVFQALLEDREAIGGDVNPVAVCVSRAKASAPPLSRVLRRIHELEDAFDPRRAAPYPGLRDFFATCFHTATWKQIRYLQANLGWRQTATDAFITALLLGALHGESHKTEWCLSNRMPRTISTKPAYSVRWWRAGEHIAPKRDAFEILRELAVYRYASQAPTRKGVVVQSDARKLGKRLPEYAGRVTLMVTSPPYLDTTNYREDQWLRLWFLEDRLPETSRRSRDDRHRAAENYWQFLSEAWAGVAPFLASKAHLVIRIGGKRVSQTEARTKLTQSLRGALKRRVRLADEWSSTIVGGQLHSFRPGAAGTKVEHDFHFVVDR